MSSFRQLMMRQKNKSDDYLAFTAQEANSTISINVTGTPTYNLKYSFDKINWYIFADSATNTINTITLNNIGDTVYIKGSYGNQSQTNYIIFVMTGKISASGNCYSIINPDYFDNIKNLSKHRMFYRLFYNCTSLTDATNLALPATNLSLYCYQEMFYGCSSLITSPELPARMLGSGCYSGMFQNCISLIQAPELPSLGLQNHCYENMFRSCSSLTKSPRLCAIQLMSGGYGFMFRDCSSLKEIKINYTGNFSITFFHNWVQGVSPTGTFYYNGTDTSNFGDSAIPTGWTVHSF